MPTLASKLGIQLVMQLGKTVPIPAPRAAMVALQHVEVANNMDGEDGFQLVFALSKSKTGEFDVLKSGFVEPDTRAAIGVLVGATLHPLINGVIYHQQITPIQDAETSTLTVMGRSIQVLMDLEEKDQSYPGLSDSAIVQNILLRYLSEGVTCLGGISTSKDTPSDKDRIPSQRHTDLVYLRDLAKQNGFIFYLEPKAVGATQAYWGPADQTQNSLPALCTNFGSATNVSELQFSQDPLAVLRVNADAFDPKTKKSETIPPNPGYTGFTVVKPIAARRTIRLRGAARFGPARALDAAAARTANAPDPVTARGTLDTLRYGDVLCPRRIVSVCGAGSCYDGDYLVRKVTHEIEVGKYTQSFTLSRKGLGAST